MAKSVAFTWTWLIELSDETRWWWSRICQGQSQHAKTAACATQQHSTTTVGNSNSQRPSTQKMWNQTTQAPWPYTGCKVKVPGLFLHWERGLRSRRDWGDSTHQIYDCRNSPFVGLSVFCPHLDQEFNMQQKKSVCIAAAPWTSRCRPPAKEMSSCGVAASPPFTRSLFHSKTLWGRQTTSLLTLLGNLTLQHVIVHIVVLTKTSVIIIGLWKGTKSSPLSPAYLLSWKWDSNWRSRRLATNKTCKWRLYALNAYHKTHKGKCKETLKREAMEVKSAVGRKWWVSFNRRFRPVWWRVEGEWSRWWICYKPACDCSTVSN